MFVLAMAGFCVCLLCLGATCYFMSFFWCSKVTGLISEMTCYVSSGFCWLIIIAYPANLVLCLLHGEWSLYIWTN